MSDGKLAVSFFEIGMVLTLVSMVLGPFEVTSWAIAAVRLARRLRACALALLNALKVWIFAPSLIPAFLPICSRR